ncbi:MAG: DMT family transporter [Vicingus serpentipes]|nr:DMT family transporter [Vicingus serpentipes]
MLDILFTVLAFNALIIIIKLFHKFGINNLQGLIVNYFVAGMCSLWFFRQPFSIIDILHADWIFHALAIGSLFITSFNFYAQGTQTVGIAITTMANKLSLLIPVGIALIIYPEEAIGYMKILGFILALIGIYLSTTKKKKLGFDKKYIWLVLLIFLGQGLADTILNNAQKTVVNDNDKGLFFMTLLFVAGSGGLSILLAQSLKQTPQIKLKNVVGGFALGIPNFIALMSIFNALENSGFAASQVFPMMSMGVIVLSALIGRVVFKEKLTLFNWIGLGFAVLSIYIITFF